MLKLTIVLFTVAVWASAATADKRATAGTTGNPAAAGTKASTANPSAATGATTSKLPVHTEASTAKPPAATKTTAKPPADTGATTLKPPAVTETTTAKPPAATETPTAKPPVTTGTTTAKPPAATEATTAKPPAATETTTAKPPAPTEATTAKPPAATETTTAKPPAPTEATTAKPPVATETTTAKPLAAATETTTAKPTPVPAAAPPKILLPEKLGKIFLQIGVINGDTKTGQWQELNQGQRLPGPLTLHDAQEQLHIKISATRKLHQVFVLLRNHVTGEEVGFVGQAVPDTATSYKVDVDIVSSGFEPGTYDTILYLGDFLIDDSLEWTLGPLNFNVTGVDYQVKQRSAGNPLYSMSYEVKPEIKHQFRQPEPRPPKTVSDAFTLLCLAPLLVLFILWIKIGVNISNFPCTLSAIAFHLGLTALLGVYVLFWVKLTMFEAFKWMGVPAFVTFVAGNRLLNYIAERRTKSQ